MIRNSLIKMQVKRIKKYIPLAKTIILISMIVLVCLPVAIYTFYQLIYFNRIYPFTRIADFDVSGKTVNEAGQYLSLQTEKTKPDKLQLLFEHKNWEFSLDSIQVDVLATVNRAYDIGRSGNFTRQLKEQFSAFWQKENLDLSLKFDEAGLETKVASIAGQIDVPAIPPAIQVSDSPVSQTGELISVSMGEAGKRLNQKKTISLILGSLHQLKNQPIILPVEPILSPVNARMAQDTKGRAGTLLGKQIVVTSEDESWKITDKELINFLSFYGGWDKEKIATYAAGLAKTINRPPQDALFNFSGGKVIEFKPSEDGLSLDEQKTVTLLSAKLSELENSQKDKIITVSLPVVAAKPKITIDQVNNLGIKELIGEGQSWFYGSIPGRIHNISLASSKLNGVLVPPGDIFSFNKAVGDVSAATGFAKAYIIQGNRTVLDDGGGVCQVSTTIFRAALNSGLPIEERHAHSYRVGYYEYNSQAGIDATVFYPSEDFKFKNDTNTNILIQSSIDYSQSKLTFQFYGASNGRKATIGKTRIWDQLPPPPDIYQDDPTLPAGTTKQVDWKAWGAKTSFDWKVIRGSEILQEKTFYSTYRPWQAIFLKGTKQ